MERLFKIGEISKLYHIGVDSLRYYEQIGLIQPRRSEAGYRLYRSRDLWRLNVIRDLRELGFSMEAIKRYLDVQNVETAISMLQEERQAIDRKLETLQLLRKNVEARLQTIAVSQTLPIDTITVKDFPPRRCCVTEKGYTDESEMDLRIKQLVNQSDDQLYIIGNNQFGSVIPMESVRNGGKPIYQSVFVIEESGDHVLPGGRYLTVSYHGAYEKSRGWIEKLLAHAAEHGMELAEEILELLWIDIHTSQTVEEHTTELQVLIRSEQADTVTGR